MRSANLLAAAALACAIALMGCDKARPLPAPGARPSGCVTCHGGELDASGAPPYSLPRDAAGAIMASGNRLDHTAATTRIEVGAHTAHLQARVSCGACHVVPAQVGSPGHNTGNRATVVFKELAAAGNVVPSPWVPAVHTCTNYCHGASLAAGGTNHAPDWLGGSAAAACGSCHFAAGATPPATHPAGAGAGGSFATTAACAACHPETVNVDGTINVTGGKHVNGVLDGGGGHSAGFADPAQHGPAANSGLQNCIACHGADFAGNGVPAKSCNACHTTNGHPNWRTECTFCHGDAARAADVTFPSVGSGTVVRANLAAPPLGSQGENVITAYAVGAHQAHLGGGTLARAAQCSECHGPTLPVDLTHVNGQIVLGWGATAGNGIVPTPVAAGNYPRWSDTTGVVPTCTNFCHGATLAGGTHTSPRWNEGPAGATCGACHRIPLPYTAAGKWHVQRQDCNTCHPGYSSTSVNLTDHVFVGAGPQGLTCTSCHGSSVTNAAPPIDITGASSGGNAIGAHQKHVAGVTLHSGNFACTECHADNGTNTRHANGVVNIVWGSTASANSTYTVLPATGTFTPGAAFPTCTNYCHNPRSTDSAATNRAPSWTSAPGSAPCGSCHGLPPAGTGHSTSAACGSCHDGYADAPTSASTASAVSLVNHINGVVNVANLGCTSCHGTAGRALAGADVLLAAAPPAAYTSTNAVGAHLAHVFQGDAAGPGPLSSPLRCANCHTGMLYAIAPHTYPPNPVAFGNLAVAANAAPLPYNQATQTCSGTYCHGNFGGGRGAVSIAWGTAGKLACDACHGQGVGAGISQPGYPHPQNTACGSCHGPAYGPAAVAVATHVDGLVTKSTSGCTACHGDRSDTLVTLSTNTVKAAPGLGAAGTSADTTGATAATSPGVGAHLAHLSGTTFRSAPLACADCHALPSSNTDVSHATGAGTGGARANVLFGALASNAGFGARTPTYLGSTTGAGGTTGGSCASTYCHAPRADTVTGLNQAPAWAAPGTVLCGDCHGLPPVAAAHPVNALCSQCHPGYPDSPTATTALPAAAKLIHINGSLDGGESSGATPCLNCHKTDAATGAAYGKMVSDTTVYHHVVAEGTAFKTYPLTATGQACLQCHADHDVFNPALNAANTLGRGANLRTTIATAPTKVAPASGNYASTDFSGTAGICLSCHAASIVKAAGQKSDGSTTTHVVSGNLYAASAHAYTVAGSITTGGSAFTANCMKCHSDQQTATYPEKQAGAFRFALHTSVDRRLRNPMGQVTPTDDRSEDHCFRCHSLTTDASPGGGPAKTVANRDYFNATAMTVASQNVFQAFTNSLHTSKHNVAGYDLIHQPTEAPGGAGGTKHVECEDCHEPHATKAGAKAATNQNTVWGPLTGVSGVTPTWGATSWTNATAYAAVTASTYEYQICFKCHSGANAGLATWGAGDWTDLALEFNPANQSRHPVATALPATDPGVNGSSQLPIAGQLINGWVKGMVMTCSDCHGADAASPAAQGPHGSAVKYMLKGTNRAWPYTTAGATTGTLFTMNNTATNYNAANGNGLFCRNCHPDPASTSTTTTNGAHIDFRGQHGGNAISTCVRCHLRVPHGGKVSRLIATSPNTPARYQVSGQTLNLLHFTKNNTGNYTGNAWFQSTCSTHSGNGSAGEAW